MKCLLLVSIFHFTVVSLAVEHNASPPLCYERWLQGYRLASGRPQKIFQGVTLRTCEDECSNTRGCAAFAYGIAGEANGTCELATRTRDSRAATNQSLSLTLSDVDASHQWDVYIEKPGDHCFKTSALYGNPSSPAGNGVPIDCFYRLMAGKRLVKNHVLKSISVNSIQECQEACIIERSFSCRSISYRYMPTGYTYSVSNCELSSYTETHNSHHDYIEDYDYDYFQREPHCKTTSSINSYGVCAVVIRRGGKLSSGLVKSSHSVNNMGKCEHLCATALFRCRAFSFRHTERGRENTYFQREQDSCLLHEADISRLPGHNIEANPDFDLYEMGRLMGEKCILYDQYQRHRNGGIGSPYGNTGGDRNIGAPTEHRPPYVGVGGTAERNYPPTDRNWNSNHDSRHYPYNYDRSRFNTNNNYNWNNRFNDRPLDRVDYRPGGAVGGGSYGGGPRDGQSFDNSSLHHHQHNFNNNQNQHGHSFNSQSNDNHNAHGPSPPSTLHGGPSHLPPPIPPIRPDIRNPDNNRPPIKSFHNNRPVYMDSLDFHIHHPQQHDNNNNNGGGGGGGGERGHYQPNHPEGGGGRPPSTAYLPGPPINPNDNNNNNNHNNNNNNINNNNRPSLDYPGPGNFHSYDHSRPPNKFHSDYPPNDINPLRGPGEGPSPPLNNYYPSSGGDPNRPPVLDHHPSPPRQYPDDRSHTNSPSPSSSDRFPEERNHGAPPPPLPPPNRFPEDRNPDVGRPAHPPDRYSNDNHPPPRYPNSVYNPMSSYDYHYPSSSGSSSERFHPAKISSELSRPDYNENKFPASIPMQISHQTSPIGTTIPITSNHHDQSQSPSIQGVFGSQQSSPAPEGLVKGTSSLMTTPSAKNDPPYYDKRREVCLVRLRQDAFLAPETSRATFPVKTIDECRVECIRSLDVLRFQCRVMSFRQTSNSGGSCQLSDQDHREIRESDYVPARDRYEGASVYFYDDRDPICRQNNYYGGQGGHNDRYSSGGYFGGGSGNSWSGSGSGSGGRYGGVNYNDRYYDSSKGRYGESRYSSDGRYDDNYNRYGYFNTAGSYPSGGSSVNHLGSSNRYYSSPSDSRYGSGGPYASSSYGSSYHGSNTYGSSSSSSAGGYGRPGDYGEYPSGSGYSTVNGERCLRSCRQNREAGFYYCQVDEQGSWDFCCRPDHFCGNSPGLSVPWCYVGTGPSQSIWRSCNSYQNKLTHNVAYLHEGPPPTIQKLTNNEVANLTKDNALLLFKGTAPVFPEAELSASNSEEIVKSVNIPPVLLETLKLQNNKDQLSVVREKQSKESAGQILLPPHQKDKEEKGNVNRKKESPIVLNGLNVSSSSVEESGNITRLNRRTPRTPTFTIVDERL